MASDGADKEIDAFEEKELTYMPIPVLTEVIAPTFQRPGTSYIGISSISPDGNLSMVTYLVDSIVDPPPPPLCNTTTSIVEIDCRRRD